MSGTFKCPCGKLASKVFTVCDECASKIEVSTPMAINEVADFAALKWYGEFGKEPTDSKAYRALVSIIKEALLNYHDNKREVKSFDTAIGYLEDEKKPMLIRRRIISDPEISKIHKNELTELERQINEIDLAIQVLKFN